MAKKDYYQILGLNHKASLKEIKAAFRQLALKYHPDHNPDNPQASKMFFEIKQAYDFLLSPESKNEYDRAYQPSPEPKAEPQRPSASPGKKVKGNLRYNLYVTLEDVVDGCERSIRYIRKNKGESETVQLKVKVPKGAFHQQRLRLVGYGDVSKEGSADLFVIVHLQNHPMFLRNGHDLRVNVPVTYLDLVLGSEIQVPTLYGLRTIKLNGCEYDNLESRLEGHGLPDHKSAARGELLVHFFVEHPSKLKTSERNALLRARKTWPEGEMMAQYESYLNKVKDQ